ncbi:amino acid transporter [Dorcoceras hygrometricum]|uniref:Amino acid transporter n=1 Tax=Dorcoceras hygrometricum TaxID=472368 RepID=A0A2Z7B808_9LAMI|nr:amino acid transporter [Dorcoceras hygrometricum]
MQTKHPNRDLNHQKSPKIDKFQQINLIQFQVSHVEHIFEEQRVETAVDSSAEETVGVFEESEPTVAHEPVVETTAEEVLPTSVDDVDDIIQQVLAETAQLVVTETAEGEHPHGTKVVDRVFGDQKTNRADAMVHWFDLPYEVLVARDTECIFKTASDTDEEEFVADTVTGTDVGVQTESCQNDYFVEEPLEGTEPVAEVEMAGVEQSVDEAMSLEDILMTIPVEVPFPSANVEITPITLGKSISIPEVDEGDWYKASLPKINPEEKGKAPLQYRDPIKGKPPKEIFSLIVVDIDLLVQLREQVLDEVYRFFNSFSFKKLPTLKVEDISEKEEQVLSWGETDSTRVALNRRMYILTKYRELLIRKFLEARKINFVPGEGFSATDLKVLEMLSDLHKFVVEDLKEQSMAHDLT